MRIMSYNPGHDGAFAYLQDGRLVTSIEAEKNSNFRHSSLSVPDAFGILDELSDVPDVLCRGGWWPNDNHMSEVSVSAGYIGIRSNDSIVRQQSMFGRKIHHFSSSHERSHLLCAYGMSPLPKGTPCYALLWEGVIGSFYKIEGSLEITKLADVMPEPGHRYALLYGLADPSFNKVTADYSRFSDAGKLMALASFANRRNATSEEERIIAFLMQDCQHLKPKECENLKDSPYYNIGLDSQDFRNLAGIFSDRIFSRFYEYAIANIPRGMPLLITGGCGLNCDWNSKWLETGHFSDVFVPPVANDSGSAIGTAIDAQFHFTGNPKIDWSVYSGKDFITDSEFDKYLYDEYDSDCKTIAGMLASNLILGWVNGKYEIGPRALGNRSILASPFLEQTRVRLNEIKQREDFRPIAPVCLEEDASEYFGCYHSSPYMLYTYLVNTGTLAAVTHVNRTARIQTVSQSSNMALYELLFAFKKQTGYGVLCNTSLNFKGRGFINNMTDLSKYTIQHNLDGYIVGRKAYLLKSSPYYRKYLDLQCQ